MPEKPPPAELQSEAIAFRDRFQTVILATAGADGTPESSYAPHVIDDAQDIYLFISDLAQHTRNLRANPRASLMYIASEADSANLFARQRLILDCTAKFLERTDPVWPAIMGRFDERFGKMMGLLRSLPDFHLVRLTVERGNYVRGFAQAYALTGKTLEIDHLRRG